MLSHVLKFTMFHSLVKFEGKFSFTYSHWKHFSTKVFILIETDRCVDYTIQKNFVQFDHTTRCDQTLTGMCIVWDFNAYAKRYFEWCENGIIDAIMDRSLRNMQWRIFQKWKLCKRKNRLRPFEKEQTFFAYRQIFCLDAKKSTLGTLTQLIMSSNGNIVMFKMLKFYKRKMISNEWSYN